MEEMLPPPRIFPGEPENPIYLPSYDGCYVCGQSHPRGLRVRFFADEEKRVYARFLPDASQTGYDDIVHGGVVSTLLDELIGWSVSLHHERLAYTAELTVRFVRPLKAGRRYLAVSSMGTGRGRCWEADGSIRDSSGEVCAKGHGKYFLLSPEQTADIARKMNYQPGDLSVFHRGV
jgi:uncharacterized protein (TIGR00369 family)